MLPSEKASAVVKDRGVRYGSPDEVFGVCAHLFQPVLERVDPLEFGPREVALFEICHKLAREIVTPGHSDNRVDICGYTNTLEIVDPS